MRWRTAHARRRRSDARFRKFEVALEMTMAMIVYAALDDLCRKLVGPWLSDSALERLADLDLAHGGALSAPASHHNGTSAEQSAKVSNPRD